MLSTIPAALDGGQGWAARSSRAGRSEPASNPRELGRLEQRHARRHRPQLRARRGRQASTSAGSASATTGGGFGWYDPKTEKLDGFWKPLSGYAVHWIAPALGGRLIAISTSTAPDELMAISAPQEAKLFVYDVPGRQDRARDRAGRQGPATGLIVEVAPGRLLGLTTEREHAGPQHPLRRGRVHRRGAVPQDPCPRRSRTDAYWPHLGGPSMTYES